MTRSYGRKQTELSIEAFNIYYNFRKRGASKWGDIKYHLLLSLRGLKLKPNTYTGLLIS